MTTRPDSGRRVLAPADNDDDPETRHRTTALVFVLLLAAGCLAATGHYTRLVAWPLDNQIGEVGRVRTGIEPDRARWFELTLLPGIGETLARRLVAYREHRRTLGGDYHRVFACPADLTQAKGIGQKTVRRLRPFLRFEDPAGGH